MTSSDPPGPARKVVKDPQYCWALVDFVIEDAAQGDSEPDALFSVPEHRLRAGSKTFAAEYIDVAAEGSACGDSRRPAVRINSTVATTFEFRSFLQVVYPLTEDDSVKKLSKDQLTAVLKLCTIWRFNDHRKRIIDELDSSGIHSMTPIERILLGRQHAVEPWLLEGTRSLVSRDECLTAEEAEELAWDVPSVLALCKLREQRLTRARARAVVFGSDRSDASEITSAFPELFATVKERQLGLRTTAEEEEADERERVRVELEERERIIEEELKQREVEEIKQREVEEMKRLEEERMRAEEEALVEAENAKREREIREIEERKNALEEQMRALQAGRPLESLQVPGPFADFEKQTGLTRPEQEEKDSKRPKLYEWGFGRRASVFPSAGTSLPILQCPTPLSPVEVEAISADEPSLKKKKRRKDLEPGGCR